MYADVRSADAVIAFEGPIRVFRVFRVLRPLRAIKQAKGLQTVIQCLLSSMQAIANVLLMTVLLIFVFSVIGVGRFKGTAMCDALSHSYLCVCVCVIQHLTISL